MSKLSINAVGYRIRFCSPNIALIRNPRGNVYRVDLATGRCSCPWGLSDRSREKECKHLVAVRELAALLDW